MTAQKLSPFSHYLTFISICLFLYKGAEFLSLFHHVRQEGFLPPSVRTCASSPTAISAFQGMSPSAVRFLGASLRLCYCYSYFCVVPTYSPAQGGKALDFAIENVLRVSIFERGQQKSAAKIFCYASQQAYLLLAITCRSWESVRFS
jgi:hypothetical protein